MKNVKVYSGKIWSGRSGENYSTTFIGYDSTPFADKFDDDFSYKKINVRYWISETSKTKSELMEDTIKRISGSVDAAYYDRYSELTGYLWTVEKVNVGGHDLLREINSYIGKYLYMEVEYD